MLLFLGLFSLPVAIYFFSPDKTAQECRGYCGSLRLDFTQVSGINKFVHIQWDPSLDFTKTP